MKKIIILALMSFCFGLPVFAQERTGYEIALERIESASVTGATSLDLSALGLTELPPEIAELSDLHWLHLGSNQLAYLPREIGRLGNLRELDISHNQLTTLPPEIGQLSSLQRLDAWDNQLINLPREMGNLHHLEWLNLSQNQLESLPLELMEIRVQWMGLHDNPFGKLPPEVIAGNREAILNYLREEAKAGKQSQSLVAGAAGSVGLVAALILGWRWKNRRGKEKSKRG